LAFEILFRKKGSGVSKVMVETVFNHTDVTLGLGKITSARHRHNVEVANFSDSDLTRAGQLTLADSSGADMDSGA